MAETKKTTKKAVKAEAPVAEVKEEAPKAEAPKKTTTKKAAAKKEEKKVEAPKKEKPTPTEARAIAYNVRVTPRKARLVKDVKVALGLLRNINRAASEPVSKVIKSAAANAINNFGFDEDRLYVAEIYANDGLKMRRYLPRAKGSASGLVKRNCHITVVVKMR